MREKGEVRTEGRWGERERVRARGGILNCWKVILCRQYWDFLEGNPLFWT